MHRSLRLLLAATALALAISGCKSGPGAGNGGASTEPCTPGETLILGCAASCGIGSCEGSGSLRVCDGVLDIAGCRGTTDTSSVLDVRSNNCGGTDSCPRTRLICPGSGAVTIVPRASFGDYICNWELEHRGILPPGGRAGETVTCTAGDIYEIGCSQQCGVGECEGSPELRICDGTTPLSECAAGTAAQLQGGTSFRSCGCGRPRVVECPASGRITIAPVTESEEICEWDMVRAPHREDGMEVCSPGQRIAVGCAQGCGLGECAAQSLLRVCDGNTTPEACRAATSSSMWLAEESGSSCDSECAQAILNCPGSGAITVVTFTGDDRPYACNWSVRNAGIGE
jgi:hypothetical protein